MRWLYLFTAALAVAFGMGACGGTQSRPHPTADAGGGGTTGLHVTGGTTGTEGCTDDTDCSRAGEFCINARCGSCRGIPPLQCPGGTFCSQSGACIDRGSTGTTGVGGTTGLGSTGTSAGDVPCTHRSECRDAQACLSGPDGGYCGAPPEGAGCDSNDGCVKAFICQAHNCVLGCLNNLDCHGTASPVCQPGNPGQCVPCTASTQCLAGEACESGQCVPAQACESAATCGALGCVNGFCGNCRQNGDCANGNVCDARSGHCTANPTSSTTAGSTTAGATTSSSSSSSSSASSTTGTSSSSSSASSTTGTSSSSSSSSASSTTGSSSSGSSGSSTTGTSGSTGSSPQPICGPCSSGADCQSGFCNDYSGGPAFCDSADYCSDAPVECAPVTTCDSSTDACICPPAGGGTNTNEYCQACYDDSDCGPGGFCLYDSVYSDWFGGGSCSEPCNTDNSCPVGGDICYAIEDADHNPLGTGCYPRAQTCE